MTYWGKKTVGGQLVGRHTLMCEPKGASDYCQHCHHDMAYVEPPVPCSVLEGLRLKQIPDDEVAAFGCWVEEPSDPEYCRPCEKWCHMARCPYSLYPEDTVAGSGAKATDDAS